MRSLLFVPADSQKKLEKGFGSGADALIIDLEDSVVLERKAAARIAAAEFIRAAVAAAPRPHIMVRVNGLTTGLTDDDLAAIVPARPDSVMLPKAEGAPSIVHLDAKLKVHEAEAGLPDGHVKIVPLVTETAMSLFLAGTYRGSSVRLIGLTWGAEDLSADLGAEANRGADGRFFEPYRFARTICLTAAAAARVQAIDTLGVDFRNLDALRAECEEARRDGFTGKLAIHPAQIPVINAVLTPTPEAVAHAEAIVAAFAAAPGAGTVQIEGVMFDIPHLSRARNVLARAAAFRGQPRNGSIDDNSE
jgi:citrate lyase subunit beta/citryl-CoA lyase